MTRETPPSWAPTAKETSTIVHQACQHAGDRADYNWTRDAPQTLVHVLVRLAEGRGHELKREGASRRPFAYGVRSRNST